MLEIGRGWESYDYPVSLEPVFQTISYDSHIKTNSAEPVIDDGRHPSFFQKLFSGNINRSQTPPSNLLPSSPQSSANERPPKAPTFPMAELQISLPQTAIVMPDATERLLLSLASRVAPTALEIIGTEQSIFIQVAVRENGFQQAERNIKAHFPESVISKTKNYLSNHFSIASGKSLYSLIVDFGLKREMLRPLNILRSFEPDPLISLISGLDNLKRNEKCVFQVLFQAVRESWAERVIHLLINSNGKPRFAESAELLTQAKQKFSRPLLAVIFRLGVVASNREQALQIARNLIGTLQTVSSPNGNELIALNGKEISTENQDFNLLNRCSNRSGMLLNIAELVSLAHLPSASVKVEKLKRDEQKTKAAPSLALGHRLVLGENLHNDENRQVTLPNEQRTRHIHIIGSTGSGKSNLLLNLIKQDLEAGEGLCVIDPHGDLIDAVIENVPENRINDVILFDPSDAEFPIGFNILQANSELEKTLLSSDLVATFRRISTSWGDVMDSVLANAILAFIESSSGGTLFDLKRFLVEKDFRNEFLKKVQDDAIRYFWQNEFPLITGKPQSSILIRLDAFLRQKLIRNIVCQKETRLNFREIMDNRKVLLVKLSQGAIGAENSHLLGTFIVSKLHQIALSRQNMADRPFFGIYIDEFHNFVVPSMEGILSGIRKYNIGLSLSHQEFRQLNSRSQEVASSVLSNCYTRICFRLGDPDAEKFASGFSFFDSKALQNLGVGKAIARIERSEYDFNLKTILLSKVEKTVAKQRRIEIVRSSRERYGTQKAEVEASLFALQTRPIVSDKLPPSETQKSKVRTTKTTAISKAAKQPLEAIPEAGNGHHYLQSIIKRIGENNGFVATTEKQVFGGIGKIDVALENEHYKIACEIAVTNTVDYELQNIQKCLASGFDKVVVISADARHLENIRKRGESVILKAQTAKVHFLEPEHFHLFLENLNGQAGSSIAEKVKVKGYRVNVGFSETSESEAETRKQTVFDIIKGKGKTKGSEK